MMPFPFLSGIIIITSVKNKVANNTTHGLKCNTIRSINFIHHKKNVKGKANCGEGLMLAYSRLIELLIFHM
jgi:hypothetical protein